MQAKNLHTRRRHQQHEKGSEGPPGLRQAGVHPLGVDAQQVQMPQMDLVNGILKHLLLFVFGPEDCCFLAFPQCLCGLFNSVSQGDNGNCDLLLSRSLAAGDGLSQAFPPLISRFSARTTKNIYTGRFLGLKLPCASSQSPHVATPAWLGCVIRSHSSRSSTLMRWTGDGMDVL